MPYQKLIPLTLVIVMGISGCISLIGGGCNGGDACFPHMEFDESFRDCGIMDVHDRNIKTTPSDVKNCLTESLENCKEAFAKQNYYGVEGQTGVSIFVVVEKNENAECYVNTLVNSGGTIVREGICKNGIDQVFVGDTIIDCR